MKKWKEIYNEYMIFEENPFICKEKNDNNIFHYTNVTSLASILKNRTLWLTMAEYMNDQNEVKYAKELILNICFKELEFGSSAMNKMLGYVFHHKYSVQGVFIMSFSEDKDLLPLWSYYSKMDGYNISFNPTRLVDITKIKLESIFEKEKLQQGVFIDEMIEVHISNVIYDEDYQKQLILKIVNQMKLAIADYKKKLLSKYMLDKLLVEYAKILRFYTVTFKQNCFYPEKETRLVVIINDNAVLKHMVNHRVSNGVMIPFIELKYNLEELDSMVDGLTIGPKNNLDIAEKGMQSFLSYEGYQSKITIKRSQIPLRF